MLQSRHAQTAAAEETAHFVPPGAGRWYTACAPRRSAIHPQVNVSRYPSSEVSERAQIVRLATKFTALAIAVGSANPTDRQSAGQNNEAVLEHRLHQAGLRPAGRQGFDGADAVLAARRHLGGSRRTGRVTKTMPAAPASRPTGPAAASTDKGSTAFFARRRPPADLETPANDIYR